MTSNFLFFLDSFSAVIFLLFSAGCFCGGERNDSLGSTVNTSFVPFCFDEFGRIQSDCVIDSVGFVAILDTGCDGLILDSAQFIHLADRDSISTKFIHYTSQHLRKNALSVSQGIDVTFGGQTLHFKVFYLDNIKDIFNVDVIFNIPLNYNYAVHLDYQSRRISLNDAIPSSVAQTHAIQSQVDISRGDLSVSFPFSIINNEGEIVSSNIEGVIDTGSGGYITAYGGLHAVTDKQFVSFITSKHRFHCISGDDILFL